MTSAPVKNSCITIYKKRVAVQVPYDPELIELFKTIDKFYWNIESKSWTFPAESVQRLVEILEQRDYQVTTTDLRPRAEIWMEHPYCKIKLNGFFEDFKALRQLSGFQYNQENRTCVVNGSNIEEVEKIFSFRNYPFILSL